MMGRHPHLTNVPLNLMSPIGSTGPLLPTIQRHYHVRLQFTATNDVQTVSIPAQFHYCIDPLRLRLHCKGVLTAGWFVDLR